MQALCRLRIRFTFLANTGLPVSLSLAADQPIFTRFRGIGRGQRLTLGLLTHRFWLKIWLGIPSIPWAYSQYCWELRIERSVLELSSQNRLKGFLKSQWRSQTIEKTSLGCKFSLLLWAYLLFQGCWVVFSHFPFLVVTYTCQDRLEMFWFGLLPAPTIAQNT